MNGGGVSTRVQLELHPDSRCEAASCIEVEVEWAREGALALRYRASGAVGGMLLPAVADSARRDELWQHTCFEAFVGLPSGGYLEFNFSPSTEWAAYEFSGYRIGMHDLEAQAPLIETRNDGEGFMLCASVELERPEGLLLGLSVVIEEEGGNKSYWAIAHPPGKPDFHHPDCFALELPALDHP